MKEVKAMNGVLRPGDLVISMPSDEYGCLVGTVTEIKPLGSNDRETDNETDDVYVDFSSQNYSNKRQMEIERQFAELYGGHRPIEDLPLDMVIMAPNTLIKITGIEADELKSLLSSEEIVMAYCDYIRCHPSKSVTEMSALLQSERANRMAYPIGSQQAYLEKLSDKLAEVSNDSKAEHENIVQAVRNMDYGMDAGEFESRVKMMFPDGSPNAMSEWISYADELEAETGHPKVKSLLEYCVEFSLIIQNYGAEIALQLFNLAESSCPNVFELRGAAKLLKDGTEISKVHNIVLENDLCMTVSEDMEFGKAIIAFVEQESKPSP